MVKVKQHLYGNDFDDGVLLTEVENDGKFDLAYIDSNDDSIGVVANGAFGDLLA